MNREITLGYNKDGQSIALDPQMMSYINLKLAVLGQPIFAQNADASFLEISKPLLRTARERARILQHYCCPADQRIQSFLKDYFKDLPKEDPILLPTNTFVLDRHGLSRLLSLPPDQDQFISEIVQSYRVKQGVLHNPKHDRRTTQGVFHVADGGLPIPDDKLIVPKHVFRNVLRAALNPPEKHKILPFTASQDEQAKLFVSLLLRPLVCPEVPGFTGEKKTEIRFFAPGNLVCNLDFVESIFGNAGDPFLPENDSALDVESWTGHTGCVILAPHLTQLKKKDVGLPHYDKATERQRRDGMCWRNEGDLYNDGKSFKLTCRDERGVMVTLIADNYFGYCKKEVKTQISYSANLYGLSEEEHAGGAIAFASYDLGDEFQLDNSLTRNHTTFDEMIQHYKDLMDLQPDGYGVDKEYPSIVYVPESAKFNLRNQSITWNRGSQEVKIKLLAGNYYVLPSGYKVHIQKMHGTSVWRMIGTTAEGTLCHKPCTVSGGGKSEIAKSIVYATLQGPVFLTDFHTDMEEVGKILERDFGNRFKVPYDAARPSRPILSPERSLGSVIKLFTPSAEYTDEYNKWLHSMPHHIKDLIYVIKRHYKTEWGKNWREYFSVNRINGHWGHELKFEDRKLIAIYLRVGHEKDGSWRIYKLRQDYSAAQKVQVEDDISASVLVPAKQLQYLNPDYTNPSVKMLRNCEYRLFQRPDDCIYRGFDIQAEKDLSSPNSFLSNYEPLTHKDIQTLVEDTVDFDNYTQPVKDLLLSFNEEKGKGAFCVASSHPRLVKGKPSKNPRYLQNRSDLVNHREKYLSHVGTRLYRQIPLKDAVPFPVNAVLTGRRMNPPDEKAGIPALAVYNPIHYQELPELFIDFVTSVTGKSPSTTGFGSEGAMTKGPFNALRFTADLNNALLDFILSGYDGFSSAAGYLGPNYKVDHDISLLIPEIWCRMSVRERDPQFLIKNGYLEKVEDFTHDGKKVPASMLGYRITIKFVHAFLGRIFSNPNAVFSEDMLKPELQDKESFVQGIQNLVTTQRRVAENYFRDGSIDEAIPPLKAVLHFMVDKKYEGKTLHDPEIRKMFTREYVLGSDWYQERLRRYQSGQIHLWNKHIRYLQNFIDFPDNADAVSRLNLEERLKTAHEELNRVESVKYLKSLEGTIGADPIGQAQADPKRSSSKRSSISQ